MIMLMEPSALAWFGSFGWPEGVLILVVVLLLFGGRKLPELAKGLGKGLREFKQGLRGAADDIDSPPEAGDDGSQEPTASDDGDKNESA